MAAAEKTENFHWLDARNHAYNLFDTTTLVSCTRVCGENHLTRTSPVRIVAVDKGVASIMSFRRSESYDSSDCEPVGKTLRSAAVVVRVSDRRHGAYVWPRVTYFDFGFSYTALHSTTTT